MKLISKGLVNKILNDIDDDKLRKSKESVDSMNLAFKTETNPYGPVSKVAKNPMSDPHLFILHFQRIL